MFELFLKGGPLMWPILVCSVIMAAIIMERAVVFWRVKNTTDEFIKNVKKELLKKKYDEAVKVCTLQGSPVSAVLTAGIKTRKLSAHEKENIMKRVGSAEIRKLDKHLRGLGIIANIAPLIGLLGTVTGLIKSFMKIQELGGRVDASILAGGIWEALLTTAAGLSVAIAAVIFYHYFEGKTEKITAEMKDAVSYLEQWLRMGEFKPDKKESEIIEEIEYGI
ncbi:MAG: MotA/TolQ/ExbB proton channel family protein [Candidatus Goldiibacteriota bacterium]